MHIGVGTAHSGMVTYEMSNTMAMIAYYQGKAGHEFNLLGKESCLVADNASDLLDAAREMSCDYLLFLDYDVQYLGVGDVVAKMIEDDKDVVCAPYYQGSFPYRPVVYDFNEDDLVVNYVDVPEKLFQVGAAGAGFILIKKKVLDLFTPELEEKMGRAFDNILRGNKVHLRADAAFFWRLKQLGVDVWVDGTIKLAHIKKYPITGEFFNFLKTQLPQKGPEICEIPTA